MSTQKEYLIGAFIGVLIFLIVSFGTTSIVWYVLSWAIGFDFTWKSALAFWVVLSILKGIFRNKE